MARVLPDYIVFSEDELIEATLRVCDFLGVDDDDEDTRVSVYGVLTSEGRYPTQMSLTRQ